MNTKTTLCILFRDEVVETVFIERSMLGEQVRFIERIPRDEHLFSAVAELMNSVGKAPTRVTLCIPRSFAIQRTLHYPVAAKNEIGNMIQFEASRHIPLAEDERLLAYAAVDLEGDSELILNLQAARRAEVLELIEHFAEVGVPVDEAVVFSSLIASAVADESTLLVVSDVNQIELCLYGEGVLQDTQLLRRDAPGFSEERLVAAARQMATKHKSWLGDEGVGRIFAAGVSPLEERTQEHLGAAFGLHVHAVAAPENLLGQVEASGMEEVLLAGSLGVEPTLNLIGDQQRKVPVSKRTLCIFALCLLLTLEILGALLLKTTAPERQRKKVANEISEMKRETADVQAMRTKNRVFRKQLIQLEQVCTSRASSMEILKTVSDALPEDTYLRQLECNQDEIVVKGYSKEPDKLPELVMDMPFVDTISTSEIGSERDGYYDFSLSASLRR